MKDLLREREWIMLTLNTKGAYMKKLLLCEDVSREILKMFENVKEEEGEDCLSRNQNSGSERLRGWGRRTFQRVQRT